MVAYIRSDLDFILAQIKIAEAHAAGQPLYGPGGLIPTYNLAWGLRTVDGSNNNLLHPTWGSSDQPFPEGLGTEFRTIMVPAGPGGALVPVSYTPGTDNDGSGTAGPSDVFDPEIRTISNLIVDQTLRNPSAILTALQRAGTVTPETQMAVTAEISAAYAPLRPLFDDLGEAERTFANASAAAAANPGNAALQATAAAAQQALTEAQAALDVSDDGLMTLLDTYGVVLEGSNVSIPNIAPDEGLSAPFNSWFTLFGQFFDHGLDLVNKGGSGTVFIPLMPDDPLYVPGGQTNFMVLTRATVAPGVDGVLGTSDDVRPVNTTTPFVDQNQTYTSHPSHQVFLRQYVLNADGDPVSTGKLIEGGNGGMATWAEVKMQAADLLGIQLLDSNVGNIPLLATDPYGNFIPGPNGFPQMVTATGLVEGDPAANGGLGVLVPANVILTGHAFLADIAHDAVPDGLADGDTTIGFNDPEFTLGDYDNELLDAHYVAGDGRANENIGLTSVHHVFHSEHNRLVEHTKAVVLQDANNMLAGGASQAEASAFLNEWLIGDVTTVPADASGLIWDGERLFQAAKFGTEMQYQHLVFEEFARKIQPNINVFLVPDGYDVTINPDIVAEFAHVVYRFGHSMLTETIDRFDPTFTDHDIGLIEGFLNPVQFANNGTNGPVLDGISAGAVIRGMTRQEGNQIDEFVTSALRNNLLGLPLDLATINLARGRDTGVPSLNATRREFYEATNEESLLKPYESWVDFAGHLKNEASIINFIAAYGTHELITDQTTIEGKRDAALTIITGISVGGILVPADALDFLNATGAYAGGALGGLENIDLWIGGLAEETMPFGGMLGSTFNFVFETQMERLQNGDRFYYLQRLDGLHLFSEMEGNSFASLIMRNTDATHLPSDVFSTPGLILEVDRTKQYNPGLGETAGDDLILEDDPLTTNVNEAADNLGNDPTGGGILTPLVIRNNPATTGPDTNYLRYTGDEHVVLGGTDGGDILIASIGDDTLFGDGGNDRLEGGFGNDIINGGAGDDIIRDAGGDDNIKGGDGNDAVNAGNGLDLVLGGAGQDFVVLGTDMGSEVFGGEGNDFILGNKNAERLLGNEGDDWLETGTFDGAPGDNFDEIFARDGIRGNDVFLGDGGFDEFIGEGGDDIFVGSPGRGKMAGMSGFDWATYKDNVQGVNADLSIPIIFDEAPTLPQNAALDEFELVNGLSGTRFADILAGSNEDAATLAPLSAGGSTGFLGSALDAQGIALVSGLQAVLGAGVTSFAAGDIILGGDGSDVIQGNAGDDIIDGDKWLDVQIGVWSTTARTGEPIRLVNSMTALTAEVFAGTINPGQLGIVRTIRTDTTTGDIDVARYQGLRSEYAFSATADGQLIVRHVIENQLDGTDRLRNIEQVKFLDGGVLNIVVGTPGNDVALNGTAQDDLILGLAGADTLNGLAGNDILVGGPGSGTATFVDNFNSNSYSINSGSANFAGNWSETNDGATSPSNGDIDINGNRLRFNQNVDGGEIIQRSINLAGATAVTLSFNYEDDDLGTGQSVIVEALNVATGLWETLVGGTLGSTTGNGAGTFNAVLTGNQIGAGSAIRFRTTGDGNNWDNGDNFYIDNVTVTATIPGVNGGVDTLNGGLGDDTYSFTLGDGNDVINEGVSATSGGSADLISIAAPVTGIDPLTDLPIMTLTGLNASDSNTGTQNGDLVINYSLPSGATSVAQTITVAGHFAGTNAQTGVERINFNSATYEGYLLGPDDYLVSRLDPGNRDTGGVNLSTSIANNFIVGENGVNDEITGGSGNDLIFGGTGDNDLFGGLGDDLLVGGSQTGDDDFLDGGADLDTMIGLAGNDTYVVDDIGDVVVEGLNAGTDTVETLMAALSLEFIANVENLTYTGIDADLFVGTGNSLNNVISGGDLADTLSGLAGNDTLDGGLGADIMIGGDGSDIYQVDDAGDVVTETSALATDIDRVESDISYALGANVENLDLNGTAISGTGNALNNVINGNDENNQIFGGAGVDTLNGGDGNDVIDGGIGNDIITGGDDNDTIIGNSGDDTIDVGGGFNTIVYNTPNFGADVINSFDAAGGTPANQDRIDLSALGITAANFTARVIESTIGGAGNTLLTITDGAANQIGTIRVNGVTNANMDITDFTLAVAGTVLPGATAGNNTLNGTANNDIISALAGNDTVNAGGGNDTITGGLNGTGGPGADVLNGDAGDDTIIWNANTATGTSLVNSDGRDQVNGGTEGAVGDTFVINGNAAGETYNIYTLAAWDAVAGNALGSFNGRTPEIVITRGGTGFANVIAELTEIEEIRINGVDPSGTSGGAGAGDSFNVFGDFSGTSLRLNTIMIDGQAGNDTVNISALSSAHRIVFRSNGGNDTIIGNLRPQDVIELPAGATAADYTTTTDANGVSTMTNGSHSVTFTAPGGMPQVGNDDEEEDEHDNTAGNDDDDDDNDNDGCGGDDDGDTDTTGGTGTTAPGAGVVRTGTPQADVLAGTAGDDNIIAFAGDDVATGGAGADAISAGEGADFVNGGDGRDVIFAGAGDDQVFGGGHADVIYGDAGADRILGDGGNDLINAGAGDDSVFGGAGNDLIVAEIDDGNDVYFGDDSDGGTDTDTLDMSAATANVTVNLGSGPLSNGTASSSQTGNDTIWGIENINTGSGSDTITASNAANVMNGGAGNDTFKFTSASAADGDTILGFEPGDRVDLTAIDANVGTATDQSFTLVTGAFTAAGQLAVTFETRADGDFTVIQGNIDGNADADFTVEIAGHQNLTNANLGL